MAKTTFNSIMRKMRTYTRDVETNAASRAPAVANLERLRGSKAYEEECERIDREIETRRVSLLNGAKKDLTGDLAKMREAISSRIRREPTPGQVATLELLDKFDKLTPTDIRQYGQNMTENPLCLRRLREIAAKHHIEVPTPTPDELLETVDRLEDHITTYLSRFRGDISQEVSPYVRQMHQFFTVDEQSAAGTQFGTLDKCDGAFWDLFVADGRYHESPEMFDDGKSAAPAARYFFRDVRSLADFIKEEKSAQFSDALKEKTEELILASCPDQYGAALRCYRATGEMVPLNETGE